MIRRWCAEDVAPVAELAPMCFPDPWTEDSLGKVFRSYGFYGFVDDDGGVINGYVGVLAVEDTHELLFIAVRPEKRGEGRGQALLSEMLKAVGDSGGGKVFLEVRVGNLPARALYEKNGFFQISVRKKYYSNGEDALVMMAVVPEPK